MTAPAKQPAVTCFAYSAAEIEAIVATIPRDLPYFPSIQYLEQRAHWYIHQANAAKTAATKKQVEKEVAERTRIVERVRRSVSVSERAERIEGIVEGMVVESIDADDPLSQYSRTRLLAQAMFDGAISEFEFEDLIVRRYLSDPGRLEWAGRDRWLHADDRKKRHRWEYINQLVCFWAEYQDVRPDEVSVSPGKSAAGNRLMDFLLAVSTRPMEEAGEFVESERIMDIVQEVRDYWRGRPWGDPEEEAILAEEAASDERARLALDDS